MGFGWQELLIILIIVALIFGNKKLRGIGTDSKSANTQMNTDDNAASTGEKKTTEQ